jgi:ribosome-binding factor A
MNFRSERVGKLIREELSKMILREVELSALATITEVEVDKKLEGARVKVSVLPSTAAAEEQVLDALEQKAGYLQHLLLKKINIKPMPRIVFVIDHGFENAALVEKLLGQDTIKAREEDDGESAE